MGIYRLEFLNLEFLLIRHVVLTWLKNVPYVGPNFSIFISLGCGFYVGIILIPKNQHLLSIVHIFFDFSTNFQKLREKGDSISNIGTWLLLFQKSNSWEKLTPGFESANYFGLIKKNSFFSLSQKLLKLFWFSIKYQKNWDMCSRNMIFDLFLVTD